MRCEGVPLSPGNRGLHPDPPEALPLEETRTSRTVLGRRNCLAVSIRFISVRNGIDMIVVGSQCGGSGNRGLSQTLDSQAVKELVDHAVLVEVVVDCKI